MIIKKRPNDYDTFDIDLINNEKVLSIYQGGSDPNLSCKYEDYRNISYISFDIPKEDEELYYIFDKLYTDIVNGNVLGEDMNREKVKERIEFQKRMSWYNQIVQNGVVTVMCDAYSLSCPNILKVKKLDDRIRLEFDKSIEKGVFKPPYCISINIRQSGSRIYDFCIPFNTMFKQLQNIVVNKDIAKSLTKKKL